MNNSFDHKFYKFDSGLRLIVVPMPATKTATVLVMVGTGSKYETKNINGISHFLEHMMFKGTTKRPGPLDISRELDAIGASYNAFTSKEYTGYYAKASMAKLDTIMDVVFDIFLNSKLDQDDIEREKGVIIEEINMYKDLPQRYVGELFEALLYGDQPAGWDTAGEKETVSALKRDDFVKYFNSHYIASNTVIAVAGNIEPEYVYKKTGDYFANIRGGDKVEKLSVIESQTEPKVLLYEKKTDQTHFIIGLRSFSMMDERRYAMSLLAKILGGGMSSRLFDEVREKRGLAYYVRAGHGTYTDSGYFEVSAGVNNEKLHEAISVVMTELKKIRDEGVTEKELQQAKDSVEGSMAIGLEDSEAVAGAYVDPILFYNKTLTPDEELVKIKAVTLDQVQSVAKDVFLNKNLNLALIGPHEDEAKIKSLLNIE